MTLGTLKPWTVIGHRKDGRPIHLIAGGSTTEDDDGGTGIDLEGDGTPVVEPDEEEEPEEDKPKPKPAAKAPTEADLARVTGALTKEREARKADRAKIRDLEAAARAAKKAGDPKAGDDEATVKAVEAATADAENRFKPMIVNEAARAALFAAGLSPDTSTAAMKKLLKTIDMGDVDVDEDGVTGLDDQVDQIKELFPTLFAKPEPEPAPPKLRAPKIDAAGRKNEQPAAKTPAQIHAARALGGG